MSQFMAARKKTHRCIPTARDAPAPTPTAMTTTAPRMNEGTGHLRRGRFATSLPSNHAMRLLPPSLRIVLVLLGASLVMWGAKGVVLDIPGLLEFNLFEMNRPAAWVLVLASVAVVGLALLRPAVLAWLGWCAALGALAFLLKDLWDKVDALSAGFAEMKAAGMPAPDLDKMLAGTKIKPGAVSIGCGLVIQAVALCLKRRNA